MTAIEKCEGKLGEWPKPSIKEVEDMLVEGLFDGVSTMPCSVCGELNVLEPDAFAGWCPTCDQLTVHYGPRFFGLI